MVNAELTIVLNDRLIDIIRRESTEELGYAAKTQVNKTAPPALPGRVDNIDQED